MLYSVYNSRSCSPESPTRRNLESGKASRISSTPARLRADGAESRPLKSDLPAYERNLTEPTYTQMREGTYRKKDSEAYIPAGSFDIWKNSPIKGSSSKGPFDYVKEEKGIQHIPKGLHAKIKAYIQHNEIEHPFSTSENTIHPYQVLPGLSVH